MDTFDGGRSQNEKMALAVFFAIGLALLLVLFLPMHDRVEDVPQDYIVVAEADLSFTEQGYRDRVIRQIDEAGYRFVCFTHLRTLDLQVLYEDVNALRIFNILVEECTVIREAFTETD